MKPRLREHIDGIGDGLSIALGIVERASSLADARRKVTTELRRARAAKDSDNCRIISELTAGSP